MHQNFNFYRGVSLIELLVALAIAALLVVVAAGGFSAFRRTQELNTAAENVTSALNEARARTLSSEGPSQYGVHFTASKAVLFKGTVFVAGDPSNKDYVWSSMVIASGWALNGGGADVVFERLTGETAQYGTVTFRAAGDPSDTKTVTVNRSGVINRN